MKKFYLILILQFLLIAGLVYIMTTHYKEVHYVEQKSVPDTVKVLAHRYHVDTVERVDTFRMEVKINGVSPPWVTFDTIGSIIIINYHLHNEHDTDFYSDSTLSACIKSTVASEEIYPDFDSSLEAIHQENLKYLERGDNESK